MATAVATRTMRKIGFAAGEKRTSRTTCQRNGSTRRWTVAWKPKSGKSSTPARTQWQEVSSKATSRHGLSVQAAANRRGILAMIGAMTSFVVNDAFVNYASQSRLAGN